MLSRPLKAQADHVKYRIIGAALLYLCLGSALGAERYQVVTEEWAPYNYQENGQLTGISTEIVQAIMALTGDEFEVHLLPGMRATLTLHTRPHTILYSMFRTPERERLYKWVGPIVEDSIYPYQLATATPPVNTLEQLLRAPRITTRHAGLLPEMLGGLGVGNLDKSASSSRQLYRMLLAGRTGIIIGDTDAGVAHYSRQLDIAPGTLRRIPIELLRAPLYIAFSRDSDDALVASWAAALAQLRRSGELARILRRYPSVQGAESR